MKKETIADKLAKKTFYSDAFQQSWDVHMQMFKPILEPAFQEDYQTKVHLAAALNHISRREIKKGFEKLKKIEKQCKTEADTIAWLTFMGVCFDMAAMKEEMLAFYQEANAYGHDFYLPYMKVAKKAYEDNVFEVAEENYRNAIKCLEKNMLAPQYRIYLASSYSSLATCLIMMHRKEEAEELLDISKKMLPEQSGREVIEVVLRALEGKTEESEALMQVIEKNYSQAADEVGKVVDKIYKKSHSQFFEIEIEEENIKEFWEWFEESQARLIQYIKKEQLDLFFQNMQPKLGEVFPFMEIDLELAIEQIESGYQITFADFYMKALMSGYEKLIRECPEEVKKIWTFQVVH